LKFHDRTLPGRGASVRDDWRAWLPQEKARIFDSLTQDLEASYAMFSVSLDEAIDLSKAGELDKSYQSVDVISDLSTRFADALTALLRSLSEHARHYGTVPSVAPLDSSNYQGPRAQRAARMNSLLSHVILSQRNQFLHKISTLNEIVADLAADFSDSAYDFANDSAPSAQLFWRSADIYHFDLNTCFREAVVLFKSFLVAMPNQELLVFDRTYRLQLRATSLRPDSRPRFLRPRRMAPIGGE